MPSKRGAHDHRRSRRAFRRHSCRNETPVARAGAQALTGHEKLVAAIQRHGKRIFGLDIPAIGVPLYSHARLYGEHGVPIVMYGAGPRTIAEAHAKGPDENLLLEDLRRATQVVACAVHDLIAG